MVIGVSDYEPTAKDVAEARMLISIAARKALTPGEVEQVPNVLKGADRMLTEGYDAYWADIERATFF